MEIDYTKATATFHVNMESSSDKSTFKGTFHVNCIISPLDLIRSDALYRELLGKTNPQYADPYVNRLSYAISQLNFRIIKAPSWFHNEDELYKGSGVDDAILLYVIDEAIKCEETYREGIKKRYDDALDQVKKAVEKGSLNDGETIPKSEEEGEDDLID